MKDCTNMELKIMAMIDQELEDKQRREVEAHIQQCDNCRSIFNRLSKLKGVTREMKFKKLPEMYWNEYWQHIYNRIERGISWILISIGAIIVLSFITWKWLTYFLADTQMHLLLKLGIITLVIGVVVLVVSILREKIMVRKVDKYREVER